MTTRLASDPAFRSYCGLKWRLVAVVAKVGLFPPFETQSAWQSFQMARCGQSAASCRNVHDSHCVIHQFLRIRGRPCIGRWEDFLSDQLSSIGVHCT